MVKLLNVCLAIVSVVTSQAYYHTILVRYKCTCRLDYFIFKTE